jgi:branched-chain amino acid transport system substrate-binding protein
LREAIEHAKSTDRDKINDAIRTLKIDPGPLMIMPYKMIEFDSTGQNPHATELILQVKDGQLVTVWPEQYASAKAAMPFR